MPDGMVPDVLRGGPYRATGLYLGNRGRRRQSSQAGPSGHGGRRNSLPPYTPMDINAQAPPSYTFGNGRGSNQFTFHGRTQGHAPSAPPLPAGLLSGPPRTVGVDWNSPNLHRYPGRTIVNRPPTPRRQSIPNIQRVPDAPGWYELGLEGPSRRNKRKRDDKDNHGRNKFWRDNY